MKIITVNCEGGAVTQNELENPKRREFIVAGENSISTSEPELIVSNA